MTARVEDFLTHQASTRPDAPALSDSLGTAWTYADFERAAQAAAQMLRDAGVKPQDRVLMLSENCATAVALIYACWYLDAVVVPVNARLTSAEVQRVLDHAKPAVVVGTSAVSEEAAAHLNALQGVAASGDFGDIHLAQHAGSTPDPDLQGVAVLLYTTGTTGTPKGVMLTHDNLVFQGIAVSDLRQMTGDDVLYGVLPITHVIGLASVLMAACRSGAHIRMEPRFEAAKLFAAVEEGVTLLSGVPQMHALVMEYTRRKGMERLGANRLRYVSSGGAPLDPAWKRKAEAFYGLPLQNGYGMTETTAAVSITANPIDNPDISTGPPLPGVEVRIDESVPGGGGGAGEVLVRGPLVMRGYYRNPEETAKVLDAEGWMHTGDLGQLDAGGNLHILGRSKELIIHGGFNVYPPEVEAALNDHPAVIQSAVIGRMEDGDEKVLAFVQVAALDTVSVEDLRAFAAERLTGYKRPSWIVLATSLPAAPTGKILKHRLIETFADQLN